MKGPRAGYPGSIECLPELIHACAGKDHVFSSMIEKELPAPKMKQVRPSVTCLDIPSLYLGSYTKVF